MALIEVQQWKLKEVISKYKLMLDGIEVPVEDISVKFGAGSPMAEMLNYSKGGTEFTAQLDPEDSKALFDAISKITKTPKEKP